MKVRANDEGLTPRQKNAVLALLQEPTISRAAVLAGVNESTILTWMMLPAFQRLYHRERRNSYGQAIGLIQRYRPLAVQTLVQVMTDTKVSPTARVAAAEVLLKFGRQGIELDDLAIRIEQLEDATAHAKTINSEQK